MPASGPIPGGSRKPLRKIYLSSTFEDLQDHRDAVCRTLRQMRHDVISMEDYTATGERPLDKCLSDVRGCDAYVGLFAWRQGYQPAGHEHSITELELLEAEGSGLPCLVFLLAEDAPWPPARIDEDRRAIVALRRRLQERFLVQYFRGADDLGAAVAAAVANQFAAAPAADDAPDDIDLYRGCVGRIREELAHDIRFFGLACVALVALAAAVFGVALAALEGPMQLVLAGGGFVLASTCPFPAATMRASRRKKAVLDGYADELTKDRPAREAVLAVRRFVEGQLREVSPA